MKTIIEDKQLTYDLWSNGLNCGLYNHITIFLFFSFFFSPLEKLYSQILIFYHIKSQNFNYQLNFQIYEIVSIIFN